MKEIKVTIYLVVILVCFVACNSVDRVTKQRDLQPDCREKIKWLYSNFKKKGKLLEPKGDISSDKSNPLGDVGSIEWYQSFGCLFNSLYREDIEKMYGKPNRITTRYDSLVIIEYYIKTKDCDNVMQTNHLQHECGVIKYEFNLQGEPKGGLIELTRIK